MHPVSDNVVRVVTVQTSKGQFKRAARKDFPLPFEGNQPEKLSEMFLII